MAKVILALQEGVIPGNLHFNSPNPDIPALSDGRFKVVSENQPWEGGLIGINSFGFGGANVHVILQSNPRRKTAPVIMENKIPVLLPLSGRTHDGVESTLKEIASKPVDRDLAGLMQEIAKSEIPGHHHRGFAVINENKVDFNVKEVTAEKRPTWFVFSGMGSQWSGMGK